MDNIKITIETNAEQAAKSFEDLDKSFSKTNNDAVDLRKEIRELKAELFKLTPGTEEYSQVLEQLGGKMNQLGDTTQELRVATGGLDTVFQTTTQATATMAAGFTAVSGVIALFGGKSEDLQKTFVKLQAVMAITTGLKGFAAFEKMTKRASISLKAYIAQSKLARTATMQQTASTAALATAEGGATVAATGLGAAIKGVTAAIAANPIGAVLVAITAAITAITHFVSASREAKKQAEEYNAVLDKSRGIALSLTEQLEKEDTQFDLQIQRLKTLGATQEEINDLMKKHLEQEASSLRHRKETLESLIDYNKENTKAKEQLEKWGAELDDVNSKLQETQNTLDEMAANTLPKFAQEADAGFAALERSLNLDVLSGNLSENGKVSQLIGYWQQRITDTQALLAKAQKKRALPANSQSVNEQLDKDIQDYERSITAWGQRIIQLEEKQQENTAKAVKSNRDAAVKLAQEHSKNYQKLNEDFNKDYEEMYKSVADFDDRMTQLFESFGFSNDESQGRMRASLQVMLKDIEDFFNKSKKTASDLVSQNKINYDDYNAYIDNLEQKVQEMRDLANHYSEDIGLTDYSAALNNRLLRNVKDLTNGLALINTLYKDGLIKTEEYNQAYLDKLETFKNVMAEDNEDIQQLYENLLDPEYLDEIVNTLEDGSEQTLREFLESQKMTAEEYVEFLKSLFAQSGLILPPELAKSITDETVKIIDSQFAIIEKKYSDDMKDMTNKIALDATSWIKGKGDTGIVFRLIFGGKDPTVAYNEAQEAAQNMYKALYDEYNAEIALLEQKKSLLDENSDAYQKYADQITEIQRKLDEAQIEYNQKQIENAQEYADKIVDAASSTFDVVSGLAGAMGSYYHEQAEQAKETYGENSAEYQKYIEKEGAMKIAQVWSDWAMGVMAAWAANAKYGVASYILAALQTAALTATAIASTQQIRRQTKTTASGANVSGITDRVVFGEAQNADQQAKLNAEYNQGASRVFVVESDINDAQKNTRTAVTSNSF